MSDHEHDHQNSSVYPEYTKARDILSKAVMLPRPARIRQITQESTRVKSFVLEDCVESVPGQFVMIWQPGLDEKPFSLANDDPLTIVVAQVGPFTTALHNLQAGNWLWWRGPFGRGYTLPAIYPADCSDSKQTLLLVGGGYGVAPLAFLARHARAAGWPVTAIVGARTKGDVILQERFTDLGCQTLICTDDGSTGQQGTAVDLAERFLQQAERDEIRIVYGCGPHAMLEALRAICCEHALPCQLSYEGFMKCGFGLCGSCAWQGLLICRDGPVLEWSPKKP
nr:dihydroorotate dehydrogenase electron transfer subunit [Chloroflexota bacterium]